MNRLIAWGLSILAMFFYAYIKNKKTKLDQEDEKIMDKIKKKAKEIKAIS